MEYIQKLPYALAAFMTIVIGIISYKNDISQQEIYLRMLVSLIVFFTIGFYVRQYLNRVYENIQLKQQNKISEEKRNMLYNAEGNDNTSTIDFRVDDTVKPKSYEEEFSPLKVSEVIRTKINDN